MAKKVFVSFAWQDDPVPAPLMVEDNQTLREALRPFLPAGVTPYEITSAIDETGANVIEQLGSQLKEGVKIRISRQERVQGGYVSNTTLWDSVT